MLARPDSFAPSGLSTAWAAPFPAWARALHPPETEAEAAFLAGAALARLDATLRETPPWAGAWRQRLALRAAAASVARAGRSEDEAALRDALHLGRPGADPGPAGRRLRAWRALAAGSAGRWRSVIARTAELLQIPSDEALQAAIAAAEACVASPRPGRGRGERTPRGLARRSVLAQRLKWPFALPLLAAPLFASAGRRDIVGIGEGAATARVLFAWAKAAANACDLSAELRGAGAKISSRRQCPNATEIT
jgi:hypothetical protein